MKRARKPLIFFRCDEQCREPIPLLQYSAGPGHAGTGSAPRTGENSPWGCCRKKNAPRSRRDYIIDRGSIKWKRSLPEGVIRRESSSAQIRDAIHR